MQYTQDSPSDHITTTKTIYQVSSFEIFYKNFIAGLARGLGSVLIWMTFMMITMGLAARILWPQVSPFINTYLELVNSLQTQP